MQLRSVALAATALGAISAALGVEMPSSATSERQKHLADLVSRGHFNDSLVRDYTALQEEFASVLRNDGFHQENKPFKVLMVSAVSDDPAVVANYELNLMKLQTNSFGDTFNMWLFHNDGSNEAWKKAGWYNNKSGPIMKRHVELGCKVQFWMKISNEVATHYDWIWLMDEGLRLDYFSWDLYRSLLARLDPLVTHPSVVPKEPGGKSTDVQILRMTSSFSYSVFDGQWALEIAREVKQSEAMSPILSGRAWPLIMERARSNDARAENSVDEWWDVAAFVASYQCSKPKPVLINSSPVRYMDFQRLRNGSWVTAGCSRTSAVNMRAPSEKEQAAVVNSLAGYCDVPREWMETVCGDADPPRLRPCKSPMFAKNSYSSWHESDLYASTDDVPLAD